MPGDIDEKLAAVDESLSAASGDDAPAESVDRARSKAVAWNDSDSHAGTARDALDGGGGAVGDEGGSVGGECGPVAPEGSVAADVAALTERVAELEAAVQALRGYAGSVRAVNDRVEERADAAVATAESLRERVGALEANAGERSSQNGARMEYDRRTRGDRRAPDASRRNGRGHDRREGGCAHCGDVGEPHEASDPRVQRDEGPGDGAETRPDSTDDAEPVSWPPTEPREPYGEVDADDDRERPGLVARLRDAL